MARKRRGVVPSEKDKPIAVPPNIGDVRPIEAPYFFVSTLNVQATGNDFAILFSRPQPVSDKGGLGILANFALSQVVAIVSMSPQTAKDLAVLLTSIIHDHEKEFGEISTPYLKRRAEKNAEPKDR